MPTWYVRKEGFMIAFTVDWAGVPAEDMNWTGV